MTNTTSRPPVIRAGRETGSAQGGSAPPRDETTRAITTAVLVTGLTFAAIGWIDVVLNLFPPAIGNVDWELATVSITIDALPLGSLGLGLSVVGAAAGRRRRMVRSLGVFAWAVAVFVLGAAGLYLLALPAVWGAVAEAMRGPFAVAVAKTTVLGTVYLTYHLWLGAFAWRQVRTMRASA